jgi:peptidylprolyl isomerase
VPPKTSALLPHRLPAFLIAALIAASASQARAAPTPQEILNASPKADWRAPDPENLLYLELPAGRVIIELAPVFAPRHVANLRTLVRAKYFDGLAVLRVQDNYVAQWGDPDEAHPRDLGKAQAKLPPEFERPARDLPFQRLADGDVYAPEVGFSGGFPVARDLKSGEAWLAHCYGMVGAGRDEAADSGNAAELYAVIGHAPRHLDRNVTLLGRVLQGIELLSSLPRGTGPLGFYERPEQRLPLRSARLAVDLPAAERTSLEVLRTDSATFEQITEARRNRTDSWTKEPAGRIELCNVPLPVRPRP